MRATHGYCCQVTVTLAAITKHARVQVSILFVYLGINHSFFIIFGNAFLTWRVLFTVALGLSQICTPRFRCGKSQCQYEFMISMPFLQAMP